MGLFGFILLIVVLLDIVGHGSTFSFGVITGFEKIVDVSTPNIKNLTQEARDYVNSPPDS
jgi:hypothetical protein